MPARYEPVEQEDEPLASERPQPSSSPASQRSLGSGTKLAFGIGAVGDSVFGGMFNGFITIYFNQAVGLNNSLIGTAIMLAMISDAVCNVRTCPLSGQGLPCQGQPSAEAAALRFGG